MNARTKGVPVDALRAFDDHAATMRVRLLSVRTMVDAKGAALAHRASKIKGTGFR